jgi:site-specific DNA-methyltransferase (adenine-specific)
LILHTGDSRHLPDILREHDIPPVPCIVGSPPYNVAIPNYPSGYADHVPWGLYRAHALQWARAIAASLSPGGRAWVNVQQTVPETPGEVGGKRVNFAYLWSWALEHAGLRYRDTILWVQDSFDGACAWGSWCQPSAPNLRGSSELILHYYRPPYARPVPPEWKGRPQPREELGGDWVDLVRNVWKINPANPGTWHSKNAAGEVVPPRENLPALFPRELPARCIRLSSWPDEWVVDPWAGHCTTGYAADELGRQSLMVDLGF